VSYLIPKELAQVEVRAAVAREGGLLPLVFKSAFHPVLLPDNTPQEIVSAWLRLQAAKHDIELIERWLAIKPPDCER